jgi:LCP family protein required for cell wall assembly
VEIPETQILTKLNALYQIDRENDTGGETVKKAVSHITGLPIHAFAALDYDGFIRMVDLLGGVSLYVDRDLFDPRFPGPNYSYETFKIDKGWQDLDGATALKYVRERHGDPEGDFGRAKRQQAILSAMKNKAFSLKTFLNPLAVSDIIDTLGEHIRTDLSIRDLQNLVGLAHEFDTAHIATAVVDAWKKDSLLRVSHVPVGSVSMFILLPRTGDWSEVRELAETLFDRDRENARKEAIAHEDARVAIVNDSDSPALGTRVVRFHTENLDIPPTRVVLAFNREQEPMRERAMRETSIVIRRGGTEALYTAEEIAKKFSLPLTLSDTEANISPENISEKTSLGNPNITLLLGNDLAKRLSFEEDTPEDIQSAESDPEYQRQLNNALSAEKK